MGAACSQYVSRNLRTDVDEGICAKCGCTFEAHKADASPTSLEEDKGYVSANERQIGGDHYKTGGEEHWDRVARLGLDYFQGQITKYIERWKKKGGIQDLRKAQHFLDKYIEVEAQKMSTGAQDAE